jgi:hypothetical protein
LQAGRLEALVPQQQRHTHGMLCIELVGHGRRNDQLHQVDAEPATAAQDVGWNKGSGRGRALEIALRVRGVQTAVAIDRQAHRQVAAHHAVVAELGYQKRRLAAVDKTIDGRDRRAAAFGVALGHEHVGAEVHAATGKHHPGWVGGAAEAVLCQRGGGAAHALGFEAVAVREVAVGGERRAGDAGGNDGKESEDRLRAFHGVSPRMR